MALLVPLKTQKWRRLPHAIKFVNALLVNVLAVAVHNFDVNGLAAVQAVGAFFKPLERR